MKAATKRFVIPPKKSQHVVWMKRSVIQEQRGAEQKSRIPLRSIRAPGFS